MKFKNLLKEKLKGKNKELDKGLEKLPSGYQKIGDIIILNLDSSLLKFKKEIGEEALEIFKTGKVRSVCNKFGEIKGKFREPQIEVIAGNENTGTTHIENNCKYKLDIRKIMFAKGNVSERLRIARQVKNNEVVVDMFAGIGYFSVPIGKLAKAKKIYSIELNPVSFSFLKENIKINHISNVEVINGNCQEEIDKLVEKGVKADRVIMGYLPPPKEFLPWAFKIIKKKGVLHYEELVNTDKEKEDINKVFNQIKKTGKEKGFDVELLLAKKIKSYKPRVDHYVFDFRVF
ncbi:MAG: class I SAM-dependent methyltransferase family protein [Nanoarchaeota archaeon]